MACSHELCVAFLTRTARWSDGDRCVGSNHTNPHDDQLMAALTSQTLNTGMLSAALILHGQSTPIEEKDQNPVNKHHESCSVCDATASVLGRFSKVEKRPSV
jgi:hypothetical protein